MKKKQKQQGMVIGGTLFVMVIILAVTSFMSRDALVEKQQLNNDAMFSVVYQGEQLALFNMEEIQAMGEQDFKANLKTSGKEPIPYTYTGVLLKSILETAGVDIDSMDKAVIYAIDGYAVSLDIEKLMDSENIYLAYMREGELIGSREEGGKGPYQMIISKDQFSQHWCKYAFEIEVN